MNKEELRELGVAIALYEYYGEVIENAKTKIREMTPEEIKAINDGIFFEIARKSSPKTTYPKAYKAEKALFEEELKEKYKSEIVTDERPNYAVTLTSTSYSRSKAEIIAKDIATKNKTEIQQMAKAGSKQKAKVK